MKKPAPQQPRTTHSIPQKAEPSIVVRSAVKAGPGIVPVRPIG